MSIRTGRWLNPNRSLRTRKQRRFRGRAARRSYQTGREKSDLEDDEPEEPQESIHATDKPDDEEPDYGGEDSCDTPTSFSDHAQEEEELHKTILLCPLQIHSFQQFLGSI